MEFKRLLSIFLAFVLSFGVCTVAFAEETADEYTPIYTAEDLNNIRNNLDGKYVLMNDIDLSVYENWEPIGSSSEPFTGELDGNGKSVFNMTIKGKYTETDNLYFAMFTAIKNSTITDLNIINFDIGAEYTGTSVEVFRAGALAGYANTSTVKNCISSGNIRLNGFFEGCAGGFFGKENVSSPTLCVNYTDIKIITENTYEIFVGGIAGIASNDNIYNCANYGNFAIECADSDNEARILKIGGIVGDSSNRNTISDCFNRGNIDVNFCMPSIYLGGISGECRAVENCYNVGTISVPENYSSYIGGIAGDFNSGGLAILPASKLENVYYINDKLYPSYVDSSVPRSNDFENVKLLTEEEFRVQDSFVGFDFENVWEMEENGYPVLKNQPKVTVDERIELAVDEKYHIKPGKDYMITSDSPICIDYISMTENGEIHALEEGNIKLTVIYDYGYKVVYDITITPPVCDDPIIPEPINNVDSAEIVHIPLKNRIVFSAGSPALPDGIVIKLKYKDGSEKTETVIYNAAEGCYRAGEERVIGSVRATVVEYGLLTDTLYINDNTVSVKYDYFVPPTLSYIFMEIVNFVLSIVL